MTSLDTEESRLIRERVKQLADEHGHELTDSEIYLWLALQVLAELSNPSGGQESSIENVDPHF